jgi:hypothetical protein
LIVFPIRPRFRVARAEIWILPNLDGMPEQKKNLRTCPNGHQYYKSSDCPTCPICEREGKPTTGFLAELGAPARRALVNNGINTLKELSKFSEKEILKFHGMGPSTIPKLRTALKSAGLSFKK